MHPEMQQMQVLKFFLLSIFINPTEQKWNLIKNKITQLTTAHNNSGLTKQSHRNKNKK
jgi:hypothetical protein